MIAKTRGEQHIDILSSCQLDLSCRQLYFACACGPFVAHITSNFYYFYPFSASTPDNKVLEDIVEKLAVDVKASEKEYDQLRKKVDNLCLEIILPPISRHVGNFVDTFCNLRGIDKYTLFNARNSLLTL